ncbi:MAG TPA: hypothetical protein VKX39_10630 [Bryobacteraceae bacterium]|jgi:hypothetical protein|nr:hypothetical protein [Bryobacteraceae bacterium]
MKPNLDTLRSEIQDYVESRGMAIFHGFPRNDPAAAVYWNTETHPDFRDFVGAAEKAGVRLITMFAKELSNDMIEDAEQRLDSLPREERRDMESRLRALRRYAGWIGQIELSFDLAPRVYYFDIHTDWYEELHDILDQIEEAEDEDETPLGGGYFSKN